MSAVEIADIRVEWAPSKKATEVPSGGDWAVFSEREHATAYHGVSARIRRGRQPGERGLSTGEAFVFCTNLDGTLTPYDPENNPSSNLKEGRQFRIYVTFNGVDYLRFHGWLVVPVPSFPAKGMASFVELQLADVFAPLAERNIEDAEFEEEVSGTRIGNVLNEIGVPAGRQEIDPGISTLVGVEIKGKKGLDELRQIAESTAGRIFASPEGKVVFLDRHRQIHPDRDYFAVKATFGADPAGLSGTEFTGTGTDDLTPSGTYTGLPTTEYLVQIDGTGPDTFRWSKDGGATWVASTVAITGSAQLLDQGVSITFGSTTGHTASDFWIFTAGEIPYAEIEPYYSPVKNLIQVRGGTGNLVEASDATSQAEYDVKTETLRASLLAADADCQDFATWRLNEGKEPHLQYRMVSFLPMVDDDLNLACWPQILSLRLGDKVRVIERSKLTGSVSQTICIVEGIEDEWDVGMWRGTSFTLSPALKNPYWILEDPQWGRLDFTTRPAF